MRTTDMIRTAATCAIACVLTSCTAAPFKLDEATIGQMQREMGRGRLTSQALTAAYLERIARSDEGLHPVLAVNPHALEEAAALDAERAAGHVRGPLHGVPIALKDNIQTTDMPTTGGALAFKGFTPAEDAALTARLRAAGAIIIAKTSMTELANWVGVGMPSGYSALGGHSLNPYDPRRDPRAGFDDGRPAMSVGGSSSGVGTAANLWAASVGTETSGSILSPANQTMLAAIKPTVGRISRRGIIPITADQDTAGPMARTVADAALLLAAMEGPDPADPATARCKPEPGGYAVHLKLDGLKGARIGIPRAFFYAPVTPPGATAPTGGLEPAQAAVMRQAIEALRARGAVIVDPADLPSVLATAEQDNFVRRGLCIGPRSSDAGCSIVFKYGFKRDFQAWLASLGPSAPVTSLEALRAFNLAHRDQGAIRYGQSLLDSSDEIDLERDRARYVADRAKDLQLAAEQGLDAAFRSNRLDALLFPGPTAAGPGAKAGYPAVMTPFGRIPNAPTPAFPDGFAARDQPYGVTFVGPACSEARLIELAYAFEQATRRRTPPPAP